MNERGSSVQEQIKGYEETIRQLKKLKRKKMRKRYLKWIGIGMLKWILIPTTIGGVIVFFVALVKFMFELL